MQIRDTYIITNNAAGVSIDLRFFGNGGVDQDVRLLLRDNIFNAIATTNLGGQTSGHIISRVSGNNREWDWYWSSNFFYSEISWTGLGGYYM